MNYKTEHILDEKINDFIENINFEDTEQVKLMVKMFIAKENNETSMKKIQLQLQHNNFEDTQTPEWFKPLE